jgi:imidazoleglycerol phosphate dehydratase HisB
MNPHTLLEMTEDRLAAMLRETELLTYALRAAAVVAAADDARAEAAIDYDNKATLDAQRKTSDTKVALEFAMREMRHVVSAIAGHITVLNERKASQYELRTAD